jgi:hypothetical protein
VLSSSVGSLEEADRAIEQHRQRLAGGMGAEGAAAAAAPVHLAEARGAILSEVVANARVMALLQVVFARGGCGRGGAAAGRGWGSWGAGQG